MPRFVTNFFFLFFTTTGSAGAHAAAGVATGTIVGAVVGAVVGCALLGLVVFMVVRLCRNRSSAQVFLFSHDVVLC